MENGTSLRSSILMKPLTTVSLSGDSDNTDQDILQKSEFFTDAGRILEEGLGIAPDTLIEDNRMSEELRGLLNNGAIFEFANRFTSNLEELPEDFTVDKIILDEFYSFIFGLLIGADNAAHLGGAIGGALFGLVLPIGIRGKCAFRDLQVRKRIRFPRAHFP